MKQVSPAGAQGCRHHERSGSVGAAEGFGAGRLCQNTFSWIHNTVRSPGAAFSAVDRGEDLRAFVSAVSHTNFGCDKNAFAAFA